MAAKPSQSTILKFYNLDELLELVKLKTKEEVKEGLSELQRALTKLVSGEEQKSPGRPAGRPAGRPPKKTGKRGRPKGSTNVKSAKTEKTVKSSAKNSGKRAKNEKPLGEFLLDILDKTPKGLAKIMEELNNKGYTTTSSNPKRLLNLELTKQKKKGTILSKGRGLYIKK